ncbi:hypothetical protein IPJ72_01620 [Candidatus Peregrinibacteria bacterium]|nr:MAG: hypothetical protein IPJ72_01620 [Candidatus Peregrinibacteria bacterium]
MTIPYGADLDASYQAQDQLERVLMRCLPGTHIQDVRNAVTAIYNELNHHVLYGYKNLPPDEITSTVLGKLGIPQSSKLGQTVRHQLLEFFAPKAA